MGKAAVGHGWLYGNDSLGIVTMGAAIFIESVVQIVRLSGAKDYTEVLSTEDLTTMIAEYCGKHNVKLSEENEWSILNFIRHGFQMHAEAALESYFVSGGKIEEADQIIGSLWRERQEKLSELGRRATERQHTVLHLDAACVVLQNEKVFAEATAKRPSKVSKKQPAVVTEPQLQSDFISDSDEVLLHKKQGRRIVIKTEPSSPDLDGMKKEVEKKALVMKEEAASLTNQRKQRVVKEPEIVLMSVEQIAASKHYPFTSGMVRTWIYKRATNGFAGCCRRIGKNIYIRKDEFDKWLDSRKV